VPGLIDVHAHVVPLSFPESPSPQSAGRWPCMQCRSTTEATVLMGRRHFRALDHRCWDGARRIEDMDRDGVSIQVLSPMPELLSYWLPLSDTEILCDHLNHTTANLVARWPSRFRGLGAVPLQDPNLAVQHLSRCRSEFRLAGVEIGSNVNGVMLGDSRFNPFYEAAQSLGMCIFVHALHPVATKAIDASQSFTSFVGFPIDVAMTAASIILEGVLERFPRLRIGLSHGGGALGAILGRMDAGCRSAKGLEVGLARLPSEQAQSLFFDNNVYDQRYLRYLVEELAPGQVFCGTDYPYSIMQREPAAVIDALTLPATARESLRAGAAATFLGEQSPVMASR
jgi:aminocarboxymuconate-semialdehyde decarboxylase